MENILLGIVIIAFLLLGYYGACRLDRYLDDVSRKRRKQHSNRIDFL